MQLYRILFLLPTLAAAQAPPQPNPAIPGTFQTAQPEVQLVPAPSNPQQGQAAAAQACAPVHLIVARASGEPPGEGTISSLSSLLKQKIPGATSEALNYPAKMPYTGSIPVGVTNMKAAIAKYTQNCPTGKLVIMGYSQGAAVMTDTLCGGGGPQVGPATPGLTAEEGKLIKAAVGMGDPRFVPGTTYDAGTNKDKGGVAQRDRSVAQCPVFASKIVSYCDMNDSRCASGNSIQVHMSYTQRYNTQAVKFVMDKLQS